MRRVPGDDDVGRVPAGMTADLAAGATDPEPVGRPLEGPPSGDATAPDMVDDAAAYVDGAVATADAVPGDGTAGTPPPFGDVDALQTAEYGPEEDAARAATSDATPTPTETHAD